MKMVFCEENHGFVRTEMVFRRFQIFQAKGGGEGIKVQVVITEKRRGRSSWIRFGEEGARILLKGVESFRKEAGKNSGGLEWRENGRRYNLELRKNDGGRFILCSVADVDGKRASIVFP